VDLLGNRYKGCGRLPFVYIHGPRKHLHSTITMFTTALDFTALLVLSSGAVAGSNSSIKCVCSPSTPPLRPQLKHHRFHPTPAGPLQQHGTVSMRQSQAASSPPHFPPLSAPKGVPDRRPGSSTRLPPKTSHQPCTSPAPTTSRSTSIPPGTQATAAAPPAAPCSSAPAR
jgi:hypothetical protein